MKRSGGAAIVRLPVFAALWAAFIAIKIPTAIAGLFVVPFLWRYRDTDFDDVPLWFLPWLNPEDWNGGPEGYDNGLPKWYATSRGVGFRAFYHYHAIRNPANGLRNFEFMDLDIVPNELDYWTPRYLRYYEPHYMRRNGVKTAGYICWQGKRAGCKFVRVWNAERHFVFKFGWRIEPRDFHERPDPDGQRALEGAGFASKLLPYREG